MRQRGHLLGALLLQLPLALQAVGKLLAHSLQGLQRGRKFPDARVVYGVRWLDVNADGVPELVAVGSPDGTVAGTNYVFKFNPGTFQSPDRFTLMDNGEFETANQLTRIETGHFNNDNLPDLLVSVNGVRYSMEQGKTVTVPWNVWKVVDDSMKADEAVAERIDRLMSDPYVQTIS